MMLKVSVFARFPSRIAKLQGLKIF